MKQLLTTCLLLCSLQATALDCGSNSARVNGKLIVRGDSEAVLQRSKPDRIVILQNRFGAVVGQRYEYWHGRRLLQIDAVGGIVSSICRG